MKKNLLFFAFVAILLATTTNCSDDDDKFSITGTWNATTSIVYATPNSNLGSIVTFPDGGYSETMILEADRESHVNFSKKNEYNVGFDRENYIYKYNKLANVMLVAVRNNSDTIYINNPEIKVIDDKHIVAFKTFSNYTEDENDRYDYKYELYFTRK